MAKFVSDTKWLNKTDEEAFNFISDLRNIQSVLPSDKKDEIECTEDTVSFTIPQINQKGTLKVVEKEPFSTIKFEASQSPIPVTIWVQFKNNEIDKTAMRLTIEAKLNPMMKMLVGNKLKDGIDKIADMVESFVNSQVQ